MRTDLGCTYLNLNFLFLLHSFWLLGLILERKACHFITTMNGEGELEEGGGGGEEEEEEE